MIETHRYMFLPEAERRIIDTLKETGRPMNVSEIVETIFGKLPYWENKQKRSATLYGCASADTGTPPSAG